jgi:NAD(P)-dependent dehydrogenase (short-subunit alcohol dehydrogenase family)
MDKLCQVAFVQGASRGIGLELVGQLLSKHPELQLFASCRMPSQATRLRELADAHSNRIRLVQLDVTDEPSIEAAAEEVSSYTAKLHLVVNVSGVLHGPTFSPEKKLGHVDLESLQTVFAVNAFGPLLVAKHFHRFLRHDERAVFASLSARVGSISDNRLGGWYAYRASKAAQNMFTKTIAIELGRNAPNAIVVGLHPGTVDTDLSQPFQRNVPEDKLLAPADSVAALLSVIDRLSSVDTGRVFDFRGEEILP